MDFLVDLDLVSDEFRPRGEVEGGEGLEYVVRTEGDVGNEGRLGVATQRVLKQEGQLGVPVSYVVLSVLPLVRKGVDAGAENRKRLVDLTALLEPLSLGLSLLLTLAARQVDKVEPGAEEVLNLAVALAALQSDGEYCMGSGGVHVHLSLWHSPTLLSLLQDGEGFLVALYHLLLNAIDEDPVLQVLPES